MELSPDIVEGHVVVNQTLTISRPLINQSRLLRGIIITLSRRKCEICAWKITHFGIKYFPLSIITFTVMLMFEFVLFLEYVLLY